jgi:hypothetical protein
MPENVFGTWRWLGNAGYQLKIARIEKGRP